MLNRKQFLAGAGATAGYLATTSALGAQTAATPATVRVASTVTGTIAPLIYGLKTGAFAKAGLDVQLTKSQNGAAVAAGVVGGSIDIGNASMPALYEAHEHGIPLTVIMPTGIYDSKAPFGAFIVLKDGPLRKAADFNGQIIGVSAIGDIGTLALRTWVDKNGGDSRTLKFVEATMSAIAATVQAGRVAAGEIGYPQLAAALESGAFRTIPAFDALGPQYALSAYFTTVDYSTRNPSIVRTFARVNAQVAAYCNTHPADVSPVLAEWTGMDPAVVAKMPKSTYGTAPDPVLFQRTIDAAANYGVLKTAFPARDIIDRNL